MLFKKQIIFFLALTILFSNLGLAFTIHYCEDRIETISLNTSSNNLNLEKNCCGVEEEIAKCCKNKVVKTGEKSDQILVDSFSFSLEFILTSITVHQIAFNENIVFLKDKIFTYFCDSNAPPLYKLYSQYTFYA
jgi:hypothetical protein